MGRTSRGRGPAQHQPLAAHPPAPSPRVLAPWPQVAAVLGELAVRYPRVWQDDADALHTEVVDLLAALRLARHMDEGLAVFPFAGRYQPQVRTLTQEVPG